MAYITKEEVKIIRDNLKKAFPEIKFSVVNDHHSTVRVTIKQSPYKFELNGKDHRDVNRFHFENDNGYNRDYDNNIVKPHTHKKMLREILDIIGEKHWDKSDAMTDYFNCSFYYYLYIGSYDAPYKKVAKKTAKAVKRVAKKVVSTVTEVGASRYFPSSRLILSE